MRFSSSLNQSSSLLSVSTGITCELASGQHQLTFSVHRWFVSGCLHAPAHIYPKWDTIVYYQVIVSLPHWVFEHISEILARQGELLFGKGTQSESHNRICPQKKKLQTHFEIPEVCPSGILLGWA